MDGRGAIGMEKVRQKRQEAVCRILFFLLACASVIFAGLFLGTAGASDLGRLDVMETLCQSMFSFFGACGFGFCAYAMKRWVL